MLEYPPTGVLFEHPDAENGINEPVTELRGIVQVVAVVPEVVQLPVRLTLDIEVGPVKPARLPVIGVPVVTTLPTPEPEPAYAHCPTPFKKV